MKLEYRRFTEPEIEEALKSAKGWDIRNGMLTKTFPHEKYLDGVAFVKTVAHIADKLNHHPDIIYTYPHVKVAVNTHDVGGISPYDFELARLIDAAV
ncbi:MAG: 4a-hydroxytetrahydrobiopterin dehydratase [Armatimonadetes bacterium]|nr:4a-hydroxytetrahydrobiopterin dehydratase [Armatimonadota bacterium]